jgi:hypothetical protein
MRQWPPEDKAVRNDVTTRFDDHDFQLVVIDFFAVSLTVLKPLSLFFVDIKAELRVGAFDDVTD